MNIKYFDVGFLVGVLICSGCETSYRPSTSIREGYSETKLAPDVVRVVFRGNSSTSKERTQDFALMRAADLSLKAGFPYFRILTETNESAFDSPAGPEPFLFKNEILVQFLKEQPAGVLSFNSAFLIRTLKEKYGIK